ncbi:hypothetical protein MASR2M70_09070 [Bacillota bacterium]
MIIEYVKNFIKDIRRLKIFFICFLLLLESITVISAAGSLNPASEHDVRPPASVGIIGGADGPTQIIVSGTENNLLVDWLISLFGRQAKGGNKKGGGAQGADAVPDEETPSSSVSDEEMNEAAGKGLLILINKENPVGKDYKPEDLAPVKYYAANRSEAGRYMREEAAEQFHKLVEVAAAEGHEIVMTTAYRSYDFQQTLWNNYVASEGEAAASRFSARPGQSEHQSGLAVDVSSPSVDYELTDRFGESEEGKWLAENARFYGFIIRFPKGKEDITGYMYEPWHIRYVGEAAAAEIYNKNITLEEFLDQ